MSSLPFKLVSADSHIAEPPDLWLKRIDRKYLERAPRIVHEADSDYFVCEGALSERQGIGLLATQPKWQNPKLRGFGFVGRWQDVPPGGYDPFARIKEMDAEGIDGELLYTSFGLTFFSIPDLDFQYAIFQAFNDWLANYCASAPNRFFGVAMLPVEPVERAVAELQRCARMGMRGAMISIAQNPGYGSPVYDPLWSAAEDLQIPLSLHVAASRKGFTYTDNVFADFSLGFGPTMYTMAAMIFSGLFDRHPRLKVISVENDASWAVAILERMDDRFEHDQGWAGFANNIKSARLPSQIFHDQIACTFMRDKTAVFNRNIIGAKNLMWGSDYPHFDGAWPNSAEVLNGHFVDVPLEDRIRIGRRNAIEFYNLPLLP